MYVARQKEEFSRAFVHAVATVAGYKIHTESVDDDSIDCGIKGNRRDGTVRRAPQLDAQLKCTGTDDGSGDTLSFSLKMKNYDDLRDPDRHIPAILIVLCVPKDLSDWLTETPEQTVMKRVAYWRSLRGEPAVSNTSNKTIEIPRSSRFTVDALTSIMQRIGNGQLP